MDSKQIFDKYWVIILIIITTLAFVTLYKTNIFADFMANRNISVFIAIVFSLFISAFLLYAFVVLAQRFYK